MKRIFLLTFGLLLAAALLVTPATAQIGQPGINGQFFEITPVRYDVTVDRGTSRTFEVSVTNRHISPITLKTVFENIVATNDDGGTAAATGPVAWNLQQYTTVNTNPFTLAPRETRKIPVTVTIPQSASPGGYYGWVRFTPTQRTDLPPVAIQGDISELFLVRVPGQTTEGGSIQDFQLNRGDGAKTNWLFFGTDGYFLTRIHNSGNVHFSTAPHIVATDQFGKTAIDSNAPAENVFPQGDRKFETKWEHISTGFYKATVTSAIPGQADTSRDFSFVVVTPRVAAAAAIVLILLIILVVRRRRKRLTAPKASQRT
jgi:hypothetical protein